MLLRFMCAIFSGLFVPNKSPHNPKNTIPTIKDLQELSPEAFEHWVADIFRARGYEAVIQGTHGTGGDHGIDIIIQRPGERAVVQCKNFRAWAVGEPTMRDLFGTMHAAGADRAYLVTTGRTTGPARAWVIGKPIEIWDGKDLARILGEPTPIASPIDDRARRPSSINGQGDGEIRNPASTSHREHNVSACPKCGSALILRTQRKDGSRFWGCSSYPKCWHTAPIEPESGSVT